MQGRKNKENGERSLPKSSRFPSMWPKIVRANSKEVYFLGGNMYDNSATELCFKLNPIENVVEEISPLKIPRYAFGSVILNHHIYCIGGLMHNEENLKSCERYNTLTDSWEFIPSM
jgi:Kelch motif